MEHTEALNPSFKILLLISLNIYYLGSEKGNNNISFFLSLFCQASLSSQFKRVCIIQSRQCSLYSQRVLYNKLAKVHLLSQILSQPKLLIPRLSI